VCSEPGRLWKRYLMTNTLFILGAFRHLLFGPGKNRCNVSGFFRRQTPDGWSKRWLRSKAELGPPGYKMSLRAKPTINSKPVLVANIPGFAPNGRNCGHHPQE
jgi:hypothetical protein